jgi:hypothetical protein
MAVNPNILYSLLHSNMEAQSLILHAYMDPPEEFEQGPETPENARPRRIIEFARNLKTLRKGPEFGRLFSTQVAAADYAQVAADAAQAGDTATAVDY